MAFKNVGPLFKNVFNIEERKKMPKDGLSEYISKDAEKETQDLTDKYISLVEKHLEAKEKEIMAV